jgi:hypothetical protein
MNRFRTISILATLALALVTIPVAEAQKHNTPPAGTTATATTAQPGTTATQPNKPDCDACKNADRIDSLHTSPEEARKARRAEQARYDELREQEFSTFPGLWKQIDFSGNAELSIIEHNPFFLIVEEEVPGRTRKLMFFNAEFPTGHAYWTDRWRQVLNKAKDRLEKEINKADNVVVSGFNNPETNRQMADRPATEEAVPERYSTADARLSELRALFGHDAVISKVVGSSLQQASAFASSKWSTKGFSIPDSIQALNGLTDRNRLEARKSFALTIEQYDDVLTKAQLDARVDDIVSGLNQRFENIEKRLAAVEQEQDRQGGIIRAIQDTMGVWRSHVYDDEKEADESFSALNAGYVNRLGLHMGRVEFEAGRPFSVRFALGGSPGGVKTQLCEDSLGVSRAFFGEVGGRYTWRPHEIVSIGLGGSAEATVLALEQSKGLVVLSAGPDVMARVNLTDHVGLQVGAGLNGRYFFEDGVTVNSDVKNIAPEFRAGLSISF